MKNFGGIKIIMIAALVLIILAGTCAAVSLSNSGGGTWKYQREISIKENSGTALTDYQVLVELKGADFPNEAKSDGADVRFTDFSGNELNYWIESWDYAGKNAKVWVKVPSISAGSSTVIRMHYGNPGAGVISNGDKVFDFFDDFEGTSLDTTKWDIVNSPILNFDNGILNIQGNAPGNGIRSKIAFQKRMVFEGRIKFDLAGYNYGSVGWQQYNGENNQETAAIVDYAAKNDYSYYVSCDGKICSGAQEPRVTDYSHIKISRGENDLEYLWGNKKLKSENIPVSALPLYFGGHGHSTPGPFNIFLDFVLARHYGSNEPLITLAPPKSSSLSITKSASPYSLRQFQESTIKILIENSGTSEVKAIEISDSIHPSFDLTGGDFPNPKKFDSIRAVESRELQYTIKSKESGAFTLDPATVTYADSEGNIQEVKSETVSIKVVPSSDGGGSGTNTGQNSKSASVSLHGEKTDVVMGEDILLRLSAVNLITKPNMHVQVIIIPPSGMSVTSSEFSKSAAGQFTANYQLEPGDGKDIEVRIRSNQIGDFNVNGRIIYYFGDDKEKAEDQTLNLPIKVRKDIASVPTQNPKEVSAQKSTPGFNLIIGISALLSSIILKRRFMNE